MAGHADASDRSCLFQLQRIAHHFPMKDFLPVFYRIYIMNHADLHMIRHQPFKLVFKPFLYLQELSGPFILSVLPDRTQMRLQYKLFPPALKCPSKARSHIRVRRIQIYAVDPALLHPVHKRFHFLIRLVHKAFTTHTDLTHL